MGVGTAGALGAIYLLDEKQGKKRRARLKKRVREVAAVTGEALDDYSREFGKKADRWSRDFGHRADLWAKDFGTRAEGWRKGLNERAREYSSDAKDLATEAVKNGWSPSARFLGAMASGVAFYGAGRPGMTGTLLRILSLGLFARALMTSR